MKLLQCRFLADENFDPASVEFLRSTGVDIKSAAEARILGLSDADVLREAMKEGRVVLSHDRDFGALGVIAAEPLIGIVFVRPGHVNADFTNRTLGVLTATNPDVDPPFILVARQKDDVVSIRIRRLDAPRN